MLKQLLLFVPLALASLFTTGPSQPTALAPDRPVASFFPADTIAFVEAPGITALLEDSGPGSYYALLD